MQRKTICIICKKQADLTNWWPSRGYNPTERQFQCKEGHHTYLGVKEAPQPEPTVTIPLLS